MEQQEYGSKYFVTSDGFVHFTASDGTEVRIPLSAKTRVFRKMQEREDLDALYFLLEEVGDQDLVKTVDDLDVVDTFELVSVWSKEFEKRLQKVISRYEAQALK